MHRRTGPSNGVCNVAGVPQPLIVCGTGIMSVAGRCWLVLAGTPSPSLFLTISYFTGHDFRAIIYTTWAGRRSYGSGPHVPSDIQTVSRNTQAAGWQGCKVAGLPGRRISRQHQLEPWNIPVKRQLAVGWCPAGACGPPARPPASLNSKRFWAIVWRACIPELPAQWS